MAAAYCDINPIICLIFSSNYRQALKRLINCSAVVLKWDPFKNSLLFILKAFLEVGGTLASEIYPASSAFICNLMWLQKVKTAVLEVTWKLLIYELGCFTKNQTLIESIRPLHSGTEWRVFRSISTGDWSWSSDRWNDSHIFKFSAEWNWTLFVFRNIYGHRKIAVVAAKIWCLFFSLKKKTTVCLFFSLKKKRQQKKKRRMF